jgi:acylglycerol lipase
VTHTTGSFTTPDGVNLFTQQWLPEGETRAGVFVMHGLAEHSGRYRHVAEFLAGRGFAVYTMDLRGHGQSEGMRGYIDSYETFLTDLDGYFQTVTGRAGRKMFTLGHSMGAALAIVLIVRHQDQLAGMVTSGTPLSPGPAVPSLLVRLTNIVAAVAPKLPVMALDATTVSRDPAVQQAYDSDPLNYRGKIRARLGAELFRLFLAAREALPRVTIPVLALQGSEDRLVDPGDLAVLYANIGSTDKTQHLYQGLYHEVFNEPEKEQVLGEVADWLVRHL